MHQDNEGRISGEIHEFPSEFSPRKDSTLKGFIEEDFISFIKTYPDIPEEVNYVGIVDEENDALYGVWIIDEEIVNDQGYKEQIYFAGTWLIKKG